MVIRSPAIPGCTWHERPAAILTPQSLRNPWCRKREVSSTYSILQQWLPEEAVGLRGFEVAQRKCLIYLLTDIPVLLLKSIP